MCQHETQNKNDVFQYSLCWLIILGAKSMYNINIYDGAKLINLIFIEGYNDGTKKLYYVIKGPLNHSKVPEDNAPIMILISRYDLEM